MPSEVRVPLAVTEDDDSKIPPEQTFCTTQACAIQYCLNRYNHQEKYCTAVIDEWKKCRDKVRKAAGWPEAKGAQQIESTSGAIDFLQIFFLKVGKFYDLKRLGTMVFLE